MSELQTLKGILQGNKTTTVLNFDAVPDDVLRFELEAEGMNVQSIMIWRESWEDAFLMWLAEDDEQFWDGTHWEGLPESEKQAAENLLKKLFEGDK